MDMTPHPARRRHARWALDAPPRIGRLRRSLHAGLGRGSVAV